jgi:hypothetical protein
MLLAMVGTAIAVNIYTLVAVVVLGAYFLYSSHMGGAIHGVPVPRLLPAVPGVNQDAGPVRHLTTPCME